MARPVSPKFTRSEIPESEHDAVWVLENLLSNLNNLVEAFEGALTLFDFSRDRGRLLSARGGIATPEEAAQRGRRAWAFIAARDGAMSVYHFYKAMKGIQAILYSCPTVRESVESVTLRTSVKQFKSKFPHLEPMRHALAHAAELRATVQKHERNTFSGTFKGLGYDLRGSKVAIQNSIANRTFTNTYEGQIISYELSDESLKALVTARDAFYEAFRVTRNPSCKADAKPV